VSSRDARAILHPAGLKVKEYKDSWRNIAITLTGWGDESNRLITGFSGQSFEKRSEIAIARKTRNPIAPAAAKSQLTTYQTPSGLSM